MKRLLAILLACAAALALAGCQPGQTGPTGSDIASSGTSLHESSEPAPEAPSSEPSDFPDSPSTPSEPVPTEPVSSELVPSEETVVKMTFAEGTTLPKMFMMLEEKGVAGQDALFEAAENGDFSDIALVSTIPVSAERCYRLEGYLFPDTYEFYVGEKPESILRKMLQNTQSRLKANYSARAAELGMTMDQIIILASLIQKEAGSVAEMATVSSVLHNRLGAGMRLQCDASITYVEYVIKPFISGDKDRYNGYYNTYKCAALPAGPIGNSGIAALEAALWPADTAYYYFAMDSDGKHYYSETYEEHEAICEEHGIGIHG